MTQHILSDNFVRGAGLTWASSEDPSAPVTFAADPSPARVWLARAGWQFSAWNRSLSFRRPATGGTTYTATLAGNYATGAAAASAVATAMQAADTGGAPPSYGCSYASSRFTITSTSAIDLRCATDPASPAVAWRDLGFSDLVDQNGGTAFAADYLSFQSRQFIGFDAGSARAASYAVLWALRAPANAAVYLGASDTSIEEAATRGAAGTALAVFTAASGVRFAAAALGTPAKRYYAFVVDPSFSPSAAAEIGAGVLFVGAHTAPAFAWTFTGFEEAPEDLAAIGFGTSGAHVRNVRGVRRVLDVDWRTLPEADVAVLRGVAASSGRGAGVFIVPDAAALDLAALMYVAIEDDGLRMDSPNLAAVSWRLVEVL